MPQIAEILSRRHGFKCTVLFAIDPKTGEISPSYQTNIPGLEALASADLMVIFTRFRDLPDEQMKYIVDYIESGRPIVGLRTATHAFYMREHPKYKKYSFRGTPDFKGGFGRQVLGETWISHHAGHGSQSTRGLIAKGAKDHPILRGIKDGDIWDPCDVYTVRLPMAEGIQPIVMGQVLDGMEFDSPPAKPRKNKNSGKLVDKNNPMMPIAWVKTWEPAAGKKARIFATTMGSSQAFLHEGSRRLIVNACYWALGMEDQIKPDSNVDLVGHYEPTRFGFKRYKKGVKPADFRKDG